MSDEYLNRIVDEAALAEYLDAELGSATAFEVTRHRAGHSNETLFVTWGERELVLRRPPPGTTADTAHDVLREYRVMDALQGTDVRVPRTVLGCDDHGVIGCDFYLMERERGDVLREDEPPRFATPERRRRIGEELVDRLAEVHAVDYEAVGLGDFGRPETYTERQVDRWHRQFDWAFDVTAAERDVPTIREVGSWLDDNVPESHPNALVHGDYKLDNVVFGPGAPPNIAGIFDWELSTLGDPRFDLGWLLTYWRDPGDPEAAIPELVPTFTDRDGYPTKGELVERYEAATGIAFENGRFYRALSVYKLAALCEMFFRRHLEGNADDPMYPKMRERVPAMADWAMRIVEGDEPI
ncbi:phosphotransferase family protein [Halomarina halobia]|uniref:Phosphotransferase family protein n=1 Tax=Halomarina halobia TaxID=3033386 RepID=A0ABD6AE04_9EURY|nr:phosphotransferase family protein [Halomarina sp. PSR21]